MIQVSSESFYTSNALIFELHSITNYVKKYNKYNWQQFQRMNTIFDTFQFTTIKML